MGAERCWLKACNNCKTWGEREEVVSRVTGQSTAASPCQGQQCFHRVISSPLQEGRQTATCFQEKTWKEGKSDCSRGET